MSREDSSEVGRNFSKSYETLGKPKAGPDPDYLLVEREVIDQLADDYHRWYAQAMAVLPRGAARRV